MSTLEDFVDTTNVKIWSDHDILRRLAENPEFDRVVVIGRYLYSFSNVTGDGIIYRCFLRRDCDAMLITSPSGRILREKEHCHPGLFDTNYQDYHNSSTTRKRKRTNIDLENPILKKRKVADDKDDLRVRTVLKVWEHRVKVEHPMDVRNYYEYYQRKYGCY